MIAWRGCVLVTAAALLLGACGATPPSEQTGASPAALPAASTASPSVASTPRPTALPEGVLASIPLEAGSAPSAVVAGFGSIWVESHRGTLLYRIDPSTDKVIAEVDVGQESCGMPGIGFGRVWLMPCDTGTRTMIVDPGTNQVVGSFEGGSGGQMAFADGSAWTTSRTLDGTFLRIDPTTLKTTSTMSAGQGDDSIVAGASFLWLTDSTSSGISKADPVSGRVVATISSPNAGRYAWLTFAFGSLWLKGADNPDLHRIDPASGKATTYTIAGWTGGLTQLYEIFPAEGLGSLWLRIANGSVVRVDPTDGRVVATFPADPAGGGGWVAVAFGSLWVANFGSDTVWRVRIEG